VIQLIVAAGPGSRAAVTPALFRECIIWCARLVVDGRRGGVARPDGSVVPFAQPCWSTMDDAAQTVLFQHFLAAGRSSARRRMQDEINSMPAGPTGGRRETSTHFVACQVPSSPSAAASTHQPLATQAHPASSSQRSKPPPGNNALPPPGTTRCHQSYAPPCPPPPPQPAPSPPLPALPRPARASCARTR
jgi:hypothetical protein